MKIIDLRIQIPCDEGVRIGDVQRVLQRHIRALGIEGVGTEASDVPALPGMDDDRAIWMAADMKQGAGARETRATAVTRTRKPSAVPAGEPIEGVG